MADCIPGGDWNHFDNIRSTKSPLLFKVGKGTILSFHFWKALCMLMIERQQEGQHSHSH